jgi:23S rRNA (uridine2552-2'-O)-methyltransferase
MARHGSGKGGGKRGGRAAGRSSGRPSGRQLKTRVKTARGRSTSSTRWLERQLNDPWVAEAKRRGLRSRAAFKLLQLDERFGLLKPGMRVVDLGAAPGGWTQVAVERTGAAQGQGQVVALDVTPIEPVAGAAFLEADISEEATPARLRAMLGGPADLVLSDMAAPATGHRQTDHLRIMALCELALAFAREVLAPGGAFVAKVLQGGTERTLLEELKRDFDTVKHAKPEASRSDSAEMYVVAQGFRGAETGD